MRKWAGGFFVLAAAVFFYVACGESPTTPGGSGVRTAVGGDPFPGPSSGPFGPSSGPFGPGGGGGGGGGTATPSATPSATATPGGPTATPGPTGTPGPPVCGVTSVSFSSTDTPVTSPGGQPLSSIITVADPNLVNCRVADIQVAYRVTGPLAAPSTYFSNYITAFPSPVAEIWAFIGGNPLSGTELGTTCGNLIFATSGSSFPPPVPPYIGIFASSQPFDSVFGQGQFPAGQAVNAQWRLDFFYDQGTLTLECWRIDFTLQP